MKSAIAKLRKHRGETQEQLALSVRVSRRTIISLEQGKFDPSLPLAFRLADHFGTTVDLLFQPEDTN